MDCFPRLIRHRYHSSGYQTMLAADPIMTCSQWAGLFSKRFCYTDPEFQASDPCMHDCIRTNIFVIYQGFWFLESRGSLLVLANVVKFPTWYSHSWNFTGPHSLEVWTETRWLMNDSTPPQTQPLYFWFTLLRVSGCVWLQSLILQRVCVCVGKLEEKSDGVQSSFLPSLTRFFTKHCCYPSGLSFWDIPSK